MNQLITEARPAARTARRIVQVLLVAGCAGCIPYPRQLYIPEGTDGRVRYSPCLPKDVPESIEFDIRGITLNVEANHRYIGVIFTMPAVIEARLQSDKVIFTWASQRPNSESTFPKISKVGGLPMNYENPALQKYMRDVREPMVGGGGFALAAYITPPPDGDFSVTLPSIAINGTVVSLPVVRFREGPFALFAPINC